ncbi:MAG TPA: M23 family metallopeptidase [Ilumatobacteraceae bacterium]|nr:M23 family metallopeptidase [Ilumatobacteraceae bacterium]
MIGAIAVLAMLTPSCYLPPVTSAIIDPFRSPACNYCPGNRGLEYAPATGSRVVAAAPGVVGFSGVVAGVRYLVVDQTDGRTATYGRLASALVAVGATVRAGEPLGTTTARFFFGLRQANRYVDPAPFLGVVRFRPRLIPVDGSAPRPVPHPTMRCALPP